jgi:hypothetical protein
MKTPPMLDSRVGNERKVLDFEVENSKEADVLDFKVKNFVRIAQRSKICSKPAYK